MAEIRPVYTITPALMIEMRTAIAEYDPQSTTTSVVVMEILRILGRHFDVTFKEEMQAEDEC